MFVPVAMGLLALVSLAFKLGVPQRYEVREQLAGINVFWRDSDAFILVNRSGEAHRHNWLTEHAPDSLRVALLRFGVEEWRLLSPSTTAYHLASGRLEGQTLGQTPMLPTWDLEDGKLVARPRVDGVDQAEKGFRWTGSGWERVEGMPVPGDAASAGAPRRLRADDAEEPVHERDLGGVPAATREKLKAAGWHFKALSGYEGIDEPAELTIDLRADSYNLSLRATRQTEPMSDMALPIKLSVSLAGKALQPSPQVLFSGGDGREVSREEFDRLAAGGAGAQELQSPGSAIAEVGRLLVPVVSAVLALWLVWKGPTRGLKIALVVFVFAWTVPWVATAGWGPVLPILVIPPTMGILTMLISTRLVRYKVRRTLVAVGEDSCPSNARAKVRELTAALEAVGFRFHEDRQSSWRMMSKDRLTFIRFFSHSSSHVWAEIQATDEPKAVGRMLCSFKGATTILTGDLQSNQELLRDPDTLAQRVPRATSSADMLIAHESFAMKAAGTLRTIEDPVAADVDGYDRWVAALVASKQVTPNGEWFSISPRAAIPITLRVMGAWFH
ncbi:MAG: hypothetical protein ACHP85_14860 [Burkholderiales bacterium]